MIILLKTLEPIGVVDKYIRKTSQKINIYKISFKIGRFK